MYNNINYTSIHVLFHFVGNIFFILYSFFTIKPSQFCCLFEISLNRKIHNNNTHILTCAVWFLRQKQKYFSHRDKWLEDGRKTQKEKYIYCWLFKKYK